MSCESEIAGAVPLPRNEPLRSYLPGSPERAALTSALSTHANQQIELTQTVNGRQFVGEGEAVPLVMPHDYRHVLGHMRQATPADVERAVDAALGAAPAWRETSFGQRAAVVLRAAELLSGPWRDTLNAATMLGQSKTVIQSEIDAACELIDFMRFNVGYGQRVMAEALHSPPGAWNQFDQRPLEGFVLAVTPFNFTSIAGNLPLAPALMGNTVVWKPSPTQMLAAHYTMRLLERAGLPPGVINVVTGDGEAVSQVAVVHPELAGIHFTGSTRTFQRLWHTVGENITRYRSYPRLVGETGGKDFVIAHPSADPAEVHTALVRGSFEYQGQKCSASSRAYLPRSLWEAGLGDQLVATAAEIRYGDIADFANFGGAVIDRRSFDRLDGVVARIKGNPACRVLAGGVTDDSVGFFVRPTVLTCDDPTHEAFTTEYFGPILTVFVYPDAEFDAVMAQAADAAPYALTGAIFATDRAVIAQATKVLRFSAGNFVINDKPTAAVVGQQPFGGARASGTNDKAGSIFNVMRWVSPRVVKETFVPANDYRYPEMG